MKDDEDVRCARCGGWRMPPCLFCRLCGSSLPLVGGNEIRYGAHSPTKGAIFLEFGGTGTCMYKHKVQVLYGTQASNR